MNKQNLELTLPEGLCTFSRGALVFTRTPSQDEWEQIGRYVHAARGSSLRWMADWLGEGRRQFGDEVVADTSRSLQMEFKDLRSAEALESLEMRSEDLSDDHHLALAKNLDGLSKARAEWQETAQRWLKIAQEEGLSPKELQKSIKAGEIVRESAGSAPTGSSGSGVLTLEAIHMDFLRWNSRVSDDGFPENWDPHQLRKVKDLTAVMADIHRRASTSLLQKGAA